MTDQPKLLPCPFCGKKPSLHVMMVNMRVHIFCDECDVKRPASEWNKRAPDPEREAMARVCEAAKAFTAEVQRCGWEVAFLDLAKALADLERARKGEAPETRCASGLALARLHSEAENQQSCIPEQF